MPNKMPVIFGVRGLNITENEKNFFQDKDIYGFILFKRNIDSKEQLTYLITELRTITISDVSLFIDQEGGRVQRILPPIVKYQYPCASFFGEMYDQLGSEIGIKLVAQNYFNLMSDLKKLDIDVVCAPVADLIIPNANNVIGNRSFDHDATNNVTRTVDLCTAALKGIENAGGHGVIKHMPGHGRALLDSHRDLPKVDAPLEELQKTDFAVFEELSKSSNEQSLAMIAHVIYTSLDPAYPATLSSILNNYIRNEIGYKGVIITDDICMKALHKNIDLLDNSAYLANLSDIASSVSNLGHIVLHCSGNISEMESVWEGITNPVTHV